MKNIRSAALIAAVVTLCNSGWAEAQTEYKMTIAGGVDPVFANFFVAKEAGIFEKNGLDVQVNTGASGSAMVPFLINQQIDAAYGSDLAGLINHNVNPKVVAVADGTFLTRWISVVGRNIDNLAGLKGKRIGVAKGTGSEVMWRALVEKHKLNLADYKIVEIEAPEMMAAIERGDIDAFSVWEPWPSRVLMSVPNTKILADSEGVVDNRSMIYMNRDWIAKNGDAADRFMKSLLEATDLINSQRESSEKMVSKFLRMPPELTKELMTKVVYQLN